MAHVFLVGFMGAGKSTVGRLVAERLAMPFVDLDDEIQRLSGVTITQMFERSGEGAFRETEHETLKRLTDAPDSVIACGGGIVLREDNRQLLVDRGRVVLLEVAPTEALVRAGSTGDRPLLAGKCASAVAKLLDARQGLYDEVADVRVRTDARTPAQVADEVVAGLRAVEGAPEHVTVQAGYASYEVLVGAGLLAEAGARLRSLTDASRAALVTDANVAELFAGSVEQSMRDAGFEVDLVVVDPGESSKDWAVAGAVINEFAQARLGRDDLVVALGGGVVGDLAGFAAATYMRGISFAQLPTTLLAQVDSAIGGKTGVDLPAGKNLAGAFWQPIAVLADIDVLGSLPETEWRSGLAEVAKAAFLDGEIPLRRLEADAPNVLARDPLAVRRAVRAAVALKARVVSADEREAGMREALNYGHTMGHAIEKVAGFGEIAHGIAVAEGIRFAALLAEEVLVAEPALRARQEALLDAFGLPARERPWGTAELVEAMRADKKARRGEVRFVLLREPGAWEVTEVDEDSLIAAVTRWLGEGTGKGVG